MATCSLCRQTFAVTDADRAFYQKVAPSFAGTTFPIPVPDLCPDCRLQRRYAFRNERQLYHRKCDKTGKQMISVYSPDKPYTVYEPSVWWSDAYDPLAYGRDFDFSKTFFEQFDTLNRVVPKSAIQNAKSENCEYTNYSTENKDCYLLVGGLGARDAMYGYRIFYSSDIVDCYDLIKCERCYECSESSGLHTCAFCSNCHNCSDCTLCDSCTGCRDCFGCANLKNKQFHIYNIPFTEAEYRNKVAQLKKMDNPKIQADVRKLHLSVPHRYARVINCENSSGDQLLDCRNCTDCYTVKQAQDCAYCATAAGSRDCHDSNFCDNCELHYNSSNLEKNYHCICVMLVWYCKETFYCMNSFNSDHLFGCTGMKKQQYCILNKQYTKEGYEALMARIIEHMKKTGEWGKFFPVELSPFCYNETIAHEYFPLAKAEVSKRGWKWFENTERDSYLGPKVDPPRDIAGVDDGITSQILTCEVTKRPYKIIPQELRFYRSMGLPLPRRCPDQRHIDRMARTNPRRLWDRACAKCAKAIRSTYAPDRPETVYCDSCYLSSVS